MVLNTIDWTGCFDYISINMKCESYVVFNFMNSKSVWSFEHYVIDYKLWLLEITMNLVYYWTA
jgi:hypothetical protein